MSYFPCDIPFMPDNELEENGIRIPKDVSDTNVGDTICRHNLQTGGAATRKEQRLVIMPQSGVWIADWSKIARIIILNGKKEGAMVNAVFDDGSSNPCGIYKTKRQCEIAIGYLYNAIADGETRFEFPQSADLPDSSNHYGASSGGNRHGGS